MEEVKVIELKESVFADNDAEADRVREDLKSRGQFLLNVMSSPGSGKTTTLTRLINLLKDTYRIGGDEFVSFACDIDEKQVLAKVHAVRCMTEERSCHVSLGVAEAKAPNIDMIDLVKHAERQMYGDKRHYYEREGKDRRGRLD